MIRNSLIGLLGLTTATVLTFPGTVQAQTFDFDRLEFIEARPIPANGTLFFFGDQAQNEGYAAYSNLDRNAPDAGHIGFRSDLNIRYYVTGRDRGPESTGATRSATLNNLSGFSNLMNYLNSNGIPLSDIGYSFGQKEGLPVTQTLNLGEDKLGQDWFGRPGSPIEESIYRANPDDFERVLYYQTTKIINIADPTTYFASANDNPDSVFGNPNIFYSNPTTAAKVPGLTGIASEIADAFLEDVAAGGGKVQEFSEDILDPEDFSASVNDEFEIFTFSFPVEIRIVSVPEPSSTLALMMLAGGSIFTCFKQKSKN